jgi:CheY-like chemotaxis protein
LYCISFTYISLNISYVSNLVYFVLLFFNIYLSTVLTVHHFYLLFMSYFKNILIIEDNLLNQKILSFYLRKENYDIQISSTGEDAITKLTNRRFDIILVDLMLPGMNGYETTEQLRMVEKQLYNDHRIIIIALTANTLDNDREKCLKTGMDGYMAKPFEMTKLVHILDSFNLAEG